MSVRGRSHWKLLGFGFLLPFIGFRDLRIETLARAQAMGMPELGTFNVFAIEWLGVGLILSYKKVLR